MQGATRFAMSARRRCALAMLLVLAGAFPAFARQAAPGAQAPAPADMPAQPLDAQIAQQMQAGSIVGAAYAVILDGKVVEARGFGFADRQRGVAFTPDTVMNIGSISKTVTGAAMMRAVEQGKLSLDADINRYLPYKVVNPHRPGTPITLRQLATHTSGITDRWEVYERTYHFGGDAPEPLGTFLAGYLVPGGRDYAPENFLDAAPGTHRDYSNIGAGLAGDIVERATGQPLNVYSREQLFVPLGMTRTRWFMREAPMDDHATLYSVDDGWPLPIQLYGGTTWPDGGVRTSVNDLSKFFIALLRGGQGANARILSRRSTEGMLRLEWNADHKPGNVDVAEKNSGLFWQTKFDTLYVGHGGSDPGVSTDMLATRDLRAGVILFTNTTGGDTGKAYVAILKALFARAQALADAAPRPPTAD